MRAKPDLPFGTLLIAAFLVAESAKIVAQLASGSLFGDALPSELLRGALGVGISLAILTGPPAARRLGIPYFLGMLGLSVFSLAELRMDLWPHLPSPIRWRTLISMIFDMGCLVYLAMPYPPPAEP